MKLKSFDKLDSVLGQRYIEEEKLTLLKRTENLIKKEINKEDEIILLIEFTASDKKSLYNTLESLETMCKIEDSEFKDILYNLLFEQYMSSFEKLKIVELTYIVASMKIDEQRELKKNITKEILKSNDILWRNAKLKILAIDSMIHVIASKASIMSKVVLSEEVRDAGEKIMKLLIEQVELSDDEDIITSILFDFDYIYCNREKLKKYYNNVEELYKSRIEYWLNCAPLINDGNIDVDKIDPIILSLYKKDRSFSEHRQHIFNREYSKQ